MSKPATLRQIHQQLANAISDLRKAGTPRPPVFLRKDRTSMTAKLQPDIEAVASDFYDIEELLTERLHEIHKTYGLDSLRDIADRLKHSIDVDVEIAMGRR